jgi:hypothetical protein
MIRAVSNNPDRQVAMHTARLRVLPRRDTMFYRIIRELDDGLLYYRGGAAGARASWTPVAEEARHYRSQAKTIRLGRTISVLVEAGRVGVEELSARAR